ncbi:MAG: DUF998 domain-containing protein [Candidatus Bathyarchaeia archaeon]
MEEGTFHEDKFFSILGIIGPLIAYTCIGLSVYLAPSFSWHVNALSDLGHAKDSIVASIFNFGLLISGFLVALYSVKSLVNYAKYTGISLTLSALMLQAVATFDEVYGQIHFIVSVLFFISAGITCIIYFLEKKPILAALAFLVGLLAWVLWCAGVYKAGIAVPELISALAVTLCIIHSAIRAMWR